MGLWNFLGGEINYDRVNKRALKSQAEFREFIITSILFASSDAIMEDVIKNEINELIKIYTYLTKEQILSEYKFLLKEMGADAPTKTRYPEFDQILGDTRLPSERKLKQNPKWQQNWTKAQKWLKKQENNKENSVHIKQLEQKIKELEERIKKLEE